MTGMTDADATNPGLAAQRAHIAARRTLESVRAEWSLDTDTAELHPRIAGAADDDDIAGLASLYVFAARVSGRQTDDPAIAEKWLTGWSSARARVPDDGRAALDAGIAFAKRLHEAMGISA